MAKNSMERRVRPRNELLIAAELFARGKIRAVLLADLSLEGALVQAPDGADLHYGEAVLVRVSGLPSAVAYVRWTYDGCVGLEFRRPLHHTVVDFALNDFSKTRPLGPGPAASRVA